MKHQLSKLLTSLALALLSLFLLADHSLALETGSFVNFTVPIRHLTPTRTQPQTTLDLPSTIHKQATHSATPVTWLLDQKVLEDQKEVSFFQELNAGTNNQVGLLLEVNSSWRSQAKVSPPNSSSVSHLLNSYSVKDRQRLLDTIFNRYFELFGHYPKTVAASYLDSTSLAYLADQYSVNSALFGVSPQSSQPPQIDGYLPYFPYYPSKTNALVPAQSDDNKIPLVVSHWNPPALSGQPQFTLSDQTGWLQPQSETFYQLLKDFSLKDLNEFTQLNFGIDNAASPNTYLPIFKYIQQQLKKHQAEFTLKPTTLSQSSSWYISLYPFTGSANYFRSRSGENFYLHYANPFYQVSFKQTDQGTFLTHLTVFNNQESETFAHQANLTDQLKLSAYPLISADDPLPLPLDLQDASFDSQYWDLIISNQQDLRLNPYSAETSFSLNLPDSKAVKTSRSDDNYTYRFNSDWSPFSSSPQQLAWDAAKLIALLLVLLSLFKLPPPKIYHWIKNHLIVSLTILVGALLWSITTVKSGTLTQFGLSFWRAHSHDSLFHLSLIESFKQSLWPLKNPNLHQTLIYNYHLIYDYLLALLSRFLNISSLDLYFRLIPPLLTIAIGFFAYRLLRRFGFSKAGNLISLLLIFTVGSLGFIPSFIQSGQLFAGQSAFWAYQAIETLINPPFALSLLLLLVILDLLWQWQSDLKLKRLFILSLLIGLLALTKVYAWLLLLAALSFTIIYKLAHSQKDTSLIKLLIFSTILSALFILPFYQSTGQLPFQLKPFWFIQSMFSSPDRLNWPLLAQKWQDLTLAGAYPKVLLLHLFGVVIFYLGNLGIRLLGLRYWLTDNFNNLAWRLIYFIVLLGLLAPLLLIQSGNSWNAIQFIYYPMFFLALFTGPVIARLLNYSHTLPKFLGLLALFSLLTFPTTVGVLNSYLSPTPSTRISSEQLRALHQLQKQPAGLAVTPLFQLINQRLYSSPKPLYADHSNAYLPALSGQPAFLADQINLEIMTYDYQAELKNAQRFYQTANLKFQQQSLEDNNIRYLTGLPLHQPDPDLPGLQLIFDSAYYPIYTINR